MQYAADYPTGEAVIPAENQNKIRILTVDDDRLILAMLAIGMRPAGYEILQAASAEEALLVAAENTIDLALLDISLPGMSGIELGKLLQKDHIPVMFLSHLRETDVVRQAAESGAVGYLVKPVDAAQIIPAIEAGLARAEQIRLLKRSETGLTAALATGCDLIDALHNTRSELEQSVQQKEAQLAQLGTQIEENAQHRSRIEAELIGLNTRLVEAQKQLAKNQMHRESRVNDASHNRGETSPKANTPLQEKKFLKLTALYRFCKRQLRFWL